MGIRNILVPVFPSIDAAPQLATALHLARGLGAHIDAVFIRPDPAVTVASFPELVIDTGFTPDVVERQDLASEAEARARFETWVRTEAVPAAPEGAKKDAVFARWSQRVGLIEAVLAERGRLSDLIVLRRPSAQYVSTERAFDAAVFDTARPALFVDTPAEDLFAHIVLSWNGSLQATRATAGALPLLQLAKKVSIFTAPQYGGNAITGLDVAEALSWHGVEAGKLEPGAAQASVGLTLLNAAAAAGATMLVMGGYTHSRVRQALLGGVTRDVLRHGTLPVLMMH